MPSDNSSASPEDPLCGNRASDLFRAAVDPTAVTSGGWQPPTPESLVEQLPQYEIFELIGRGGMGAVYRGLQIELDRQVAIKILPSALGALDPNFAARFKGEARSMAKLHHPGIVSVYDFGVMPNGTLFFVMEFVEGTDVAQMVAQQGRLSSAHAMAITAHVCDALQYAHEKGVVHRDIKPANIMVGFNGKVKVTDFGLSKSLHSMDVSLTQSGHVMGTPHFLAPEGLMAGVTLDHRADVYAVGVMLYQMLTGKLPQGLFEMPSLQVPGLDPRYDAIISNAMRENREQRFQTILDLRMALDGILTKPVVKSEVAEQTIPPKMVGPKVRSPVPVPSVSQTHAQPRKKSFAGKAVIALALAGAAAAYVLMQQTPTEVVKPTTPLVEPTVVAATFTETPATPLAKGFTNSLGMKFVPVPGTGVLFCIHETRRKDYAAYAAEFKGAPEGWKSQNRAGMSAEDEGDHPVCGVNWSEAKAFCLWLSKKEGRPYRLPTDREWSCAMGIQDNEQWTSDSTPETRSRQGRVAAIKMYPWGSDWPPGKRAGNFGDATAREAGNSSNFIEGYRDGYAMTAPVMSFPPNPLGLYDLSGNAWEWVEDWYNGRRLERTWRGGSWVFRDPDYLLSCFREHSSYQAWFRDLGFRVVISPNDPVLVSEPAPQPPATPAVTSEVITFAGHRYQFIAGGFSWDEAKAAAEKRGGHLATLTSDAENARVFDLLQPCMTGFQPNCRIGGFRRGRNASWEWVTGEPFGYAGSWFPGEPNSRSESAYLKVWKADPASPQLSWDDTSENVDSSSRGFLMEWDDDGKKSMPAERVPSSPAKTNAASGASPPQPASAPVKSDPLPANVLLSFRYLIMPEAAAQSILGWDGFQANPSAALPGLEKWIAEGKVKVLAINAFNVAPGESFFNEGTAVTEVEIGKPNEGKIPVRFALGYKKPGTEGNPFEQHPLHGEYLMSLGESVFAGTWKLTGDEVGSLKDQTCLIFVSLK